MILHLHNFQFNAIWNGRSMAALIFCRRLAEGKVTVMPSVMCMDYVCDKSIQLM
jgi:hypothetical protein